MLWGTFSVLHIITMVLGAALLVGLYFLLKNKSTKTQTTVLGVLSFLGYAAIVYEFFCKGEPLANLPLHLCSINAMILPFVVFTKDKTFGNLLLVWCLGALAALVLNYDMTDDPILSWNVFFYYFPHLVEFGIPILLVALGHVKKDPKCIISTVVISMVIYTIVHFLNLLIISQTGFAANYMFSMRPNNPLVDLFYSWIPCRYWYMYLVLPIVVVYLLVVYSPELVRHFKNKKEA